MGDNKTKQKDGVSIDSIRSNRSKSERLRREIKDLLPYGPDTKSARNGRTNFETGTVLMILGTIMAMHGYITGGDVGAAITALGGTPPPFGSGELFLGILVGLVGLVLRIFDTSKEEKEIE